jgi:glycine/D-amino acid oxidase-like deaminating enzyme
MAATRDIIIVGAGIIGMSCALSLRREGHQVTVLDFGGPGEGTSKGNAGAIASAGIVPLSGPGMLTQIPRWLLDPVGPLAIRWRYLPRALPWLLRFVAAGRADRVEAQATALRSLYERAYETYQPLLQFAGASGLFQRLGYVAAYETDAAWRKDQGGFALRRRRGVAMRELDAAALHALEPTLAPNFRHGMHYTENGHVADPYLLVRKFADAFTAGGGVIKTERVADCALDGGAGVRIVTDHGEHRAECLVIAAGARSHHLAARLGSRVPLETQRGYHATLPNPGVTPRLPVSSGERKFLSTPMAMGLRFAGTVEFAGLDAPPDWRRAEVLVAAGKQIFPGLDGANPSFWMGHRPCLPDSLPVIGPAPQSRNVLYAFGHGHLGLTGGAVTGQIIADLVANRAPPTDITPFRVDRF